MRRVLVLILFHALAFVVDGLLADIFKFDPNYIENGGQYNVIEAEILGEGSFDESGSEEGDSEEDEEGTFESPLLASLPKHASAVLEKEGIEDRVETNLVNLRRVIYLIIMNALNYEEAVHKLLKVQLKEGRDNSNHRHWSYWK